MKFIVQREYLLKPLQKVSSPLCGRPLFPILSNLLLHVSDNTLSLTGTNLEMEMVARIALSEPHHLGKITISARKFFDICRSLPKEAKILVQLEGHRILIYSGASRFSLSTLPATDFPNIDNWQSQVEFTIPQATMKRLIEATQFSMAHKDVRYYLNGMLLEIDNEELRAVATDGHRLAICSIQINNILPKYSVIVPRKGIIELMHMLESSSTPVRMQLGRNNIRAHLGNFIFTTKLIDSCFPDYRSVLPKKTDKKLEVNCNTFRQALSRASILSNETLHSVHLYISKNKIKIIANNHEQDESEEILDVIYTGEEIDISFNISYIMDVLNVLECENARILLTNSTSSVQIEDTSSQSSIYVIMPIRI